MSGATFRKVVAGQPLRPAAADWNAAMDAAKGGRLRRTGDGFPVAPEHYQHALVLNATEEPVERFHVLKIERPAILPHAAGADPANLDGFADRLRVHGVTPAEGDFELAVATEDILDDALGRCAVSGIAPALVEIDDEDHTAASAQAGTMLISSSRGPCTIVWKQDIADRAVEGVALCLVRILGGRPAGGLFMVLVTQTGGVAGDASTTCTFVYTVKDLYGVEIGTAMAPKKRFQPETPYVAGGTDIPGTAYYDQNGDLQLYDPNALLDAEEC